MATQRHSVYTKKHQSDGSLRWRFCNGVGCLSHDDKMDLVTIQGRLTGERYIHNVLEPVVIPHFENHPLATRPVYMDDNARPHCSRAVTAYFQGNAIETLPWPARSPDLNPLEHIGDILGRQIQKMDFGLWTNWKQLCIVSGTADHSSNSTSDRWDET